MKKILPVVLVVGGYLLYHFYEVKKAITNLTIRLSSISINGQQTGLLQTVLHFELQVYNPASLALAFQQFFGNVVYQGEIVGSFNISLGSGKIYIQPRGISIVPLDAEIENLNALMMLPSIIKNGLNAMSIQGVIVINGIQLPVNMTYQDLKSEA